MLDIIRQHSQSWGVKLLFGLIVLVFVFWGVGSFSNNNANVLAKVNERTITVQDFLQKYEQRLEALRQQQPNLSSENIRAMHFKQQVFDLMVNQELLAQLAQKEGIAVSNVELRNAIMQMPVFLNKEGQFDTNRYQMLLQANRMTPAQFETGYAQELKLRKLQEYLTLAGTVSQQEARDFFRFAREQARIDYIMFNEADYLEQVKPTKKEISAYYEAHKDSFAVPEQIKIDYLQITPETLAHRENITEAAITAYYNKHPKEFTQEEEVKAKHILIKVAEDAADKDVKKAEKKINKILARYKKGTSFASLAKKFSQGPSKTEGGDLGWFPKGRMVPSFEKAAFALKKGEVSKPVRTPFGWHLIFVEDRKPEGILPLDKARDDIRLKLARDKAADAIQDTLDQALESIITGQKLAKVADSLGVTLKTSDFFTQATGPASLQLPPKAVGTLFAFKEGETTQTPILLEDGYLLATKVASKPPHTLELARVAPRITSILKQEGARAIAQEKAAKELTTLLEKPDTKLGKRLQTSEPFGRQGFIPGLGMNPQLVEKAFNAKETSWFDTTFPVTSGVILARFKERIQPDEADWDKESSYWQMSLEQARKQEIFSGLITSLRQKASITVMNPRVLEN